ncbi:MAG: DUF362 domain-containing protein [Methermicoccaceae archaeon]
MSEFKVVVIETTDPYGGTLDALKQLNACDDVHTAKRVLIKPNCVTDDHAEKGITTHPMMVRAVCDYLKECGLSSEQLTVAEGGMASYDTLRTFERTGLKSIVEGTGVRLVDMNRDERLGINIRGALALKSVGIARSFLNHDFLISCAKLKVHSLATATLCMKNMMGGVLPKSTMHARIHEKIVDLNRVFAPKLSLIDGIVGAEAHETIGYPVISNVVVASNNVVACDAVGCYLMGIEPEKVGYLALAQRAGLGTCDLSQIDVEGDIKRLRRTYIRKMEKPVDKGGLIDVL